MLESIVCKVKMIPCVDLGEISLDDNFLQSFRGEKQAKMWMASVFATHPQIF